MRLSEDDARARLAVHDHGVLCTVHAERGVDAVPVSYALHRELIGIPIDTVKPKSATRLQRQRNLEADPRATLLIEHWDVADWSKLWWVRAELRLVADPGSAAPEALAERLVARYEQYTDRPFADMLVLRIVAISGWAA